MDGTVDRAIKRHTITRDTLAFGVPLEAGEEVIFANATGERRFLRIAPGTAREAVGPDRFVIGSEFNGRVTFMKTHGVLGPGLAAVTSAARPDDARKFDSAAEAAAHAVALGRKIDGQLAKAGALDVMLGMHVFRIDSTFKVREDLGPVRGLGTHPKRGA